MNDRVDPLVQFISMALPNALEESSLSVSARHFARQITQAAIPTVLPVGIKRIEKMPGSPE